MVERDDGIYLKDPDNKELIAYEDPETGEWVAMEEDEETETLPPATAPAVTDNTAEPAPAEAAAAAAAADSKPETTQTATSTSETKPAEKPEPPAPPATESYLRKLWCRDDGTIEVRRDYRKTITAQCDVSLIEQLRQIQYVCRRLLKAAQSGPNFTYADQVLCAVAITVLDLFDPVSAEVRERQKSPLLKDSIHSILVADDLEAFEPMRTRAKCLIKSRLECCAEQ
ncbi:hypothetical protein GNI_031620 [Gregarina niphandrodes]|uniref:Uncharacterized protein n=1 Tax=Gregarina niphandrodes TaxID=110365 RepID=A0A023BAZ9_GRENI|nr:hypothetical protein GNI_031620 [Gregarina niphandrodes]EZG78870.1 hypothetical protein GNI_031620 [Gregarina niphandrodes]|eukprot:XP_011129178.1 hypothetical protein GNI_031620 [Gregarina niphandrodes]